MRLIKWGVPVLEQKCTVLVDIVSVELEADKNGQTGFSVIITKRTYEQYLEIAGGDLSVEC